MRLSITLCVLIGVGAIAAWVLLVEESRPKRSSRPKSHGRVNNSTRYPGMVADVQMEDGAGASESPPVADVSDGVQPQARIEGVIYGESNTTVASAEVCAWIDERQFPQGFGVNRSAQPSAIVTSDERGRFSMVVHRDSAYLLDVRAKSYSRSFIEGCRAGLMAYNIHLEKNCATLRGKVTVQPGFAAKDVHLALSKPGFPEACCGVTETDAYGDYDFGEGVGTGRYVLTIVPQIPYGKVQHVVELSAGEVLEHNVELSHGLTVFGSVVTENGAPAEGVVVTCALEETTTGPRGRYELLCVRPMGMTEVVIRGPFGVVSKRIQVGESNEVNFIIQEGILLHGRVQDAAGEGIEGASLKLSSSSRTSDGRRRGHYLIEHTDSYGDFKFVGVIAERTQHVLTAASPGKGTRALQVEIAEAADQWDVGLIRLDEEAVVDGYLVGSARPEILRAKVESQEAPFKEETALDSKGRFRIGTLASGSYTLVVFAEDGRDVVSERIQVEPGEVKAVTLNVPEARTSMVGGVVHSRSGVPLPGMRVALRGAGVSADVMSDELGAFAFEELPEGERFAITVFPQGVVGGQEYFWTRVSGIESGSQALRIEVPEVRVLSGTVSCDGKRCAGAIIKAFGGDPIKFLGGGTADGQGRFHVKIPNVATAFTMKGYLSRDEQAIRFKAEGAVVRDVRIVHGGESTSGIELDLR